ncbi:hypothetical protein AOC05_06415 [Arthrobacter alpinus]|uniref:Uncharacterized protein n=1 Tax=Arthrobacter alpinus TaxID=656366 RepID=A0A0M4RNW3_9MICC|nr:MULTISPECIES: pirin-like C-terminal cupin domain-containing protein [Arthrobacter]ALE92051.1 hypothetical protein AOC05_06415 [Arthrobacter alpinus]
MDPAFEHGLLLDTGSATVAAQEVTCRELCYVRPGRDTLTFVAGSEAVRLLLIGGTPLANPA